MTGRAVWRVGPGQWFARAATARTFGATAPPAAAPLPVHRALTSLHVAGSCSVDCSRAIAGRTPSAAVVGAAARGLKTPYPSVQFEPTAGVVTRGGSGTSLTPERLATEVSPLLARGGEAAVVVPPLPATRFSPEWSAVFAACEAERETAAGCGVTLRLDWTVGAVRPLPPCSQTSARRVSQCSQPLAVSSGRFAPPLSSSPHTLCVAAAASGTGVG